MQKKHTENFTENQEKIFRALYGHPRTKEELATAINVSVKTISNNLPLMLQSMCDHDVVRSIDGDGEIYFQIVQKKVFIPETQNKIFTYARSAVHPYMVVNLPEPPNKEYWRLYLPGDFHYGSTECDYQAVQNTIETIECDENGIAIWPGDMIENSNKDSIADGVFRQLMPPQQQQDNLIIKLAPIAHKTLLLTKGNHDNRTIKTSYLSPEQNIANALSVEAYEGFCFVDIICGNHKWELLAHHGATGAATLAGRLNAIMKKNTFTTADIFVMGHTHDKQIARDVEVVRDTKHMRLVERERVYILTGGFLKPHMGYANKRGFAPLTVGSPYVDLYCAESEYAGKFKAVCESNSILV